MGSAMLVWVIVAAAAVGLALGGLAAADALGLLPPDTPPPDWWRQSRWV